MDKKELILEYAKKIARLEYYGTEDRSGYKRLDDIRDVLREFSEELAQENPLDPFPEGLKYQIESGVEMPEAKRNPTGAKGKYPFPDMKIGDSFLYSRATDRTTQQYAGSAARMWAKKRNNGWKFSTRKTEEGVRIWRVE
jgi:hypothetical protein